MRSEEVYGNSLVNRKGSGSQAMAAGSFSQYKQKTTHEKKLAMPLPKHPGHQNQHKPLGSPAILRSPRDRCQCGLPLE